ncbi:MAG: hypothetical protein KDC72_08605 [Bacteroidetes bacterium]|nr:hypothetical protein [Bacteroidota bacterium]
MSKDKKTLFKKEICILGGAKVILESEDKRGVESAYEMIRDTLYVRYGFVI